MERGFISIGQEDDFRDEFDFLVAHGETGEGTFEEWMESQGFVFDEERNLWSFPIRAKKK